MKYKAVIADVDGTLFPPSEMPSPKPSEKLIEAVKKVTEMGVAFSIASGRSLSWVEEIIRGFDLKTPIILDNGARIYDCKNKKYIWESLLSKETAEKVLSVFKKDKTLRVYIADDDERLSGEAKITKWKISKILVLGVTPAKADKLYKELKMIPYIHATKSVSWTGEKSQSVHVTNFDATKQVAVGKLLEILRLRKEEVIGIGDSYNDFPLLMASGLRVAMRNAVPEIKEIADYIAPSYEEEGVVEVLERFIIK
ncbi:HAD family phosphatase [Candidatus Gottesmanbacteria bacterium]|nr:HAD family phosphatase [Candidatus Gottesmanbacteria bacterium]